MRVLCQRKEPKFPEFGVFWKKCEKGTILLMGDKMYQRDRHGRDFEVRQAHQR